MIVENISQIPDNRITSYNVCYTKLLRKSIGSKEIKMIYNDEPNADEPVKNITTTPEERGNYVLNDDEILIV